MSIVIRDFVNDKIGVKSYLRTILVPTFFASYTSSSNEDSYKDSNSNTLFTVDLSSSSSSYANVFGAYKSNSVYYKTDWTSGTGRTSVVSKVISCDGGVLIIGDGIGVIITRTNNNGICIILRDNYKNGTTGQEYKYQGVRCFSWGDITAEEKSLTFSPTIFSQTQLIPFCTYCQYDTNNYTPDAFWIPFGEFYSVTSGKFTGPNGVEYVTNGYWAIRDQNSLASG